MQKNYKRIYWFCSYFFSLSFADVRIWFIRYEYQVKRKNMLGKDSYQTSNYLNEDQMLQWNKFSRALALCMDWQCLFGKSASVFKNLVKTLLIYFSNDKFWTYAYETKICIIKCMLLWTINLTLDNEPCSMNLNWLTEKNSKCMYHKNVHKILSLETRTKSSVAVSTDL